MNIYEPARQFIIFDTEYTTWDGALLRRWQGHNEYRELIELGAIKVAWPSGEIFDELSVLVQPTINPILSDYCTQLTGITQEVLDRTARSFDEVLQDFCHFCGNNPTISYGNDAGILGENIALKRADPGKFYGRGAPAFIDITHWFRAWDTRVQGLSSGELWTIFGGQVPEHFVRKHSALSDCYSILQAMKYLRDNGVRLPI